MYSQHQRTEHSPLDSNNAERYSVSDLVVYQNFQQSSRIFIYSLIGLFFKQKQYVLKKIGSEEKYEKFMQEKASKNYIGC